MADLNEIKLELEKYRHNSYLTHNFHPYPAKYIPQIPAQLIKALSRKGDWILDPFCGSGTTLVECRLLGRNGVGLDANPLACLIAQTKVTELNNHHIAQICDAIEKIHSEIEQNTRYPKPNHPNIDHWFESFVQDELAIICANIEKVDGQRVRNFLQIALSAIIVKVSNQDSDTRYKAVKKNLHRGDVERCFVSKLRDMLKRIKQFGQVAQSCSVQAIHADSTKIKWNERTFDLVVTSPPYLNSYDYYLYHKHRMIWLGLDYRDAQKKEFGSRNKHNDQGLGLECYNDAITQHVVSVKQALKKGGYYCVVVGDGILRGELIKMNINFDGIFSAVGFQKAHEIAFEQRKYTRTFTPNLKRRYKESYILIYQNI